MRRNRILIIEDEPDVLTYFEAFFQDNGFDTLPASDARTGFKLARSEKPDLITLDITMPGQSGMGTYSRLKGDPDLSAIPIVVITATIDSLEDFRRQTDGLPDPDCFVSKPVSLSNLLEKISKILTDRH
jgi:CheY-like chemotaxis protein